MRSCAAFPRRFLLQSERLIAKTEEMGRCDGGCGEHGRCEQNGRCFCRHSWLGRNCEVPAFRGCFGGGKWCLDWALDMAPATDVLGTAAAGDAPQPVVYAQLSAETTGWVGLIFDSSDGLMTDGDVWISHVNDATREPYVMDGWSSGFVTPSADGGADEFDPIAAAGDIVMIGGEQNGTHTRVQFLRALNAADGEDKTIKSGMTSVAWALGSGDQLSKHANDGRGSGEIDWCESSRAHASTLTLGL